MTDSLLTSKNSSPTYGSLLLMLFVGSLAIFQTIAGILLTRFVIKEQQELMPLVAVPLILIGGLAIIVGLIAAWLRIRFAPIVAGIGALMGLPLVATFVFAPVPLFQFVAAPTMARRLLDRSERLEAHPQQLLPVIAGRLLTTLAVGFALAQVALGSVSVWNALQEPRPGWVLTIIDYIRGGRYDPGLAWPSVIAGLAVAFGGALVLYALSSAAHHRSRAKALIVLGAAPRLVLFGYLAPLGLLVTIFGVLAVNMLGGRPQQAMPSAR